MPAITDNKYGQLIISNEVFTRLVGLAVTGCYGVIGMSYKSKTDGIVSLLKKDALEKGVTVWMEDRLLYVELHIMVEYGVNLPAVCESIISRVRYEIETATEFEVGAVKVCVDAIRAD